MRRMLLAAGGGASFAPPAPTLSPSSTITATKSGSNPTFNFACLPESITKVGSTYYSAYIATTSASEVRLATSSSRHGPWTDAGSIYAFTSIPWRSGQSGLYSPFITEDAGTFYLFYSLINDGSTNALNAIGVATASAITGTYTDSGAAILSPGAGSAWDSRRVGECDVVKVGSTWVMAYMGETSTAAFQASEKLGIATASSPTGTWTKAGGNPIAWGASGQFDDALMADPNIFYANGYYWIWYAGGIDAGPSTRAEEGFLYATDPTDIASWQRHSSNPILTVGSGGSWDDVWVFRGAIYEEGGTYTGTYCGYSGAAFKGGNFTLSFS